MLLSTQYPLVTAAPSTLPYVTCQVHLTIEQTPQTLVTNEQTERNRILLHALGNFY